MVSTDLDATATVVVEQYSHRWSVEVCFRDTRQDAGVGQARNRARRAVERTVPSARDMLAKLRRVLIAAQYRPGQPQAPTVAELLEVQAAWAAARA